MPQRKAGLAQPPKAHGCATVLLFEGNGQICPGWGCTDADSRSHGNHAENPPL